MLDIKELIIITAVNFDNFEFKKLCKEYQHDKDWYYCHTPYMGVHPVLKSKYTVDFLQTKIGNFKKVCIVTNSSEIIETIRMMSIKKLIDYKCVKIYHFDINDTPYCIRLTEHGSYDMMPPQFCGYQLQYSEFVQPKED